MIPWTDDEHRRLKIFGSDGAWLVAGVLIGAAIFVAMVCWRGCAALAAGPEAMIGRFVEGRR